MLIKFWIKQTGVLYPNEYTEVFHHGNNADEHRPTVFLYNKRYFNFNFNKKILSFVLSNIYKHSNAKKTMRHVSKLFF